MASHGQRGTATHLTQAFDTRITQRVRIWDQTLRDGEQAPGIAFSREEKLELARMLSDLGVAAINAGFPAMSPYEADTIRAIAGLGLKCEVGALARMRRDDMDAAIDCGVTWLQPWVPISISHIRDKLGTTEEALLEAIAETVPHGVRQGCKVSVAFEDATRAPLERLLRFARAACEAGASAVRIADTVGILTPTSTKPIVAALKSAVDVPVITHFHNDLGLGTANALAAIEAGADMADATLLGIGERAGNTCLEELAVILAVVYGVDTGIELDKLVPAVEFVSRATGVSIAPNKPIVGENVFSHESGMHVQGILINPDTYNPFPPELLGRVNRIVYGKHSGLSGIRALLDREGIALDADQQSRLLARVKEAGQQKSPPSETEIAQWARSILGASRESP